MSVGKAKNVYEISVFADNFQFQIQDQVEDCEYPVFWNDALLTQLYICGHRIIGIGTVRDLDVDVVIEVYQDSLDEDEANALPELSDFDHAVQCNIELPSGKMLVTGCSTGYDETTKLELPARFYGVRIFWSGLERTDELGFEGDDRYLIQLFPDTNFQERVLKSWRQLGYQLNPDNN